MLKVGFVGWRGLVGSVLFERMSKENDFARIVPQFFSTSDVGGIAPHIANGNTQLLDAYNLDSLLEQDCIVSTQGSDYTNQILPQLRSHGYTGYWLDASSAIRMAADNVIVLDPVNRKLIDDSLRANIKNYSVGNCTVTLVLLALNGLFKRDLIEWVSSMTYQAASGAGAVNMRELLLQSGVIYDSVKDLLMDKNSSILDIDAKVSQVLTREEFPTANFKAPLAYNLLPWIDSAMDNGQTREEWKAEAEGNKILGLAPNTIKMDGICVRVGALRCHSQALTIKLKHKDLDIATIESYLRDGNPWLRYVANNQTDTLANLTPASVSNTLDIAVGRLRKLAMGDDYLTLFTIGDQLLWGAAEPLRRALNIVCEYHNTLNYE